MGHLLLYLVVGLHWLATLAAHLGRALSDSRPVARTRHRARHREPVFGGWVAVAPQPPGAAIVTSCVGARECWRRPRAAVVHCRLPLCARAHGSTAVPVGVVPGWNCDRGGRGRLGPCPEEPARRRRQPLRAGVVAEPRFQPTDKSRVQVILLA